MKTEFEMKVFLCIWGEGYIHSANPAIVEKHCFDFFTDDSGYARKESAKIGLLTIGEHMSFPECGNHVVIRIE